MSSPETPCSCRRSRPRSLGFAAVLRAILVVLLVGCGQSADTGSGTGSDDPFGEAAWILAEATVDGQPLGLLPAHPISLTRTSDGIAGTSACNHYGGTLLVEGTMITIGDLFRTEMACLPDEVMTLESEYLAALGRVSGATVADGSLTLSGEGVELIFDAEPPVTDAPLVDTAWALETMLDGEVASSTIAGSEADLSISDRGDLSGSTGCNRFNATITWDDEEWEAVQLATTRMACAPGLMEQENAVIAVLSGGPRWLIEGSTLTLTLPDGRGLIYRVS